ncbi:MAG: hypothetical protein O7C59_07260, partial [Rickettsia endosymbiont of Ixodes persulcatus]|nr:hypothetical protein [Rickettsia endosymbiont of Ixodes persulcatus]
NWFEVLLVMCDGFGLWLELKLSDFLDSNVCVVGALYWFVDVVSVEQSYLDCVDVLLVIDVCYLVWWLLWWDSNLRYACIGSLGVVIFGMFFGISDFVALDVVSLWVFCNCVDELWVLIGIIVIGESMMFDFKDEVEGGMGLHGLMIGMMGLGKLQTLMLMLLLLLITYFADCLIVIYVDFKGEVGVDIFWHFF